MTITIDHNIPAPANAKWWGKCNDVRTALATMSPQDSFVIQDRTAYSHVYRLAREVGIEIVTNKVNGSGWRIWRVK